MRALRQISVTRACAFAAIALALLGAITLVAAARHDAAQPQSYTTNIGELRRVVLDPQAVAHLNTDTAISVTTTPGHCDIVLNRGEALLEIRPGDPARVRVRAGNVIVQPDASTFAVRLRDADHVDILVRAGTLALTNSSTGAMRAFTDTRLAANQSAHVSPSGLSIKDLDEADIVRRLGWTAGVLWFEGETLEEAAQEFNRYNIQRLVIEDPSISELHIGGKFRCTDPEHFVEALHALGVRKLERDSREASTSPIRLVGAR